MKSPLTVIVGVFACAALIATARPEPADVTVPDCLEAKDEAIRFLEAENEQLRRELLFIRIERCESTFNHAAVSPSGKCRGRYQFKRQTFEWMKRRSGLDHLEYTEAADQELLARWAMENKLQDHWECYQIVTEKWPELAVNIHGGISE